jgi:hypothetical protein
MKILNFYSLNDRASKHMKQKLIAPKGEPGKPMVIAVHLTMAHISWQGC